MKVLGRFDGSLGAETVLSSPVLPLERTRRVALGWSTYVSCLALCLTMGTAPSQGLTGVTLSFSGSGVTSIDEAFGSLTSEMTFFLGLFWTFLARFE